MRSHLFVALAVSFGVASSYVAAAEAPAGRYQLVVYQPGVVGQSLVLLDTTTGDIWLLDNAPAPLPDGFSPVARPNEPVLSDWRPTMNDFRP